MNNTFNINRFMLLFKKRSVEQAKTYLLSIAVLTGMLFIILGFVSFTDRGHLDKNPQGTIFMFFLLLGGSIYTSLSFTEMGDKKMAIPALALPASHFEKYLVSWLYSYVIFQLVCVGVFYFADSIVIQLGSTPVEDRDKLIDIFSTNHKDFPIYLTFVVFALFHGFTFWGAIFFEKLHFIKTAFVFFVCLIILVLVNNLLLSMFIKDVQSGPPFLGAGVYEKNIDRYWKLTPTQGITDFSWYIIWLTALLLWTSAFFKLKEKQV